MNSHGPIRDGERSLRRRPLLLAATLLLGLALARQCLAAENADPVDLDTILARKGTIVLREATLDDWILGIQQEWKVNIVGGGDLANESVSGAFTDTPLRDVLGAILYTRGYGYQPVGNSLLIMKLEDIGPIKPQSEIAILPLDLLDPTDVEETVRLLISNIGSVQAVPSSNSLMVIDLPERIARIREHLRLLEDQARQAAEREQQREREAVQEAGPESGSPRGTPMSDAAPTIDDDQVVQVFEAQFVNIDTLTETVQSVLGTEGRATAMSDERRMAVVGTPSAVKAAAEVIRQLDIPRAQVRISALLYDVELETMERFGFNWSHAAKGRISPTGDPQSLFEMNSTLFQGGTTAAAAAADAAGGAAEAAADAGGAAATVASSTVGGLATLTHLSRHLDVTAFISALDQTGGTISVLMNTSSSLSVIVVS